jgi:hypothetical protein
MPFHLTNPQLLIGAIALVFVALLAVAAYLDFRRKRTPPFLNYFDTAFDQDQFDRDHSRQGSFLDPDVWHNHNQTRMQVHEVRDTTTQHRS